MSYFLEYHIFFIIGIIRILGIILRACFSISCCTFLCLYFWGLCSRLMVIKKNIVDRMTGSAGPASGGSGSRYSYLPSRDSIGDDLETGQSMGLGIEFKAL